MGTNNGSDILSMFSSGNVAIGTTTDDGTNLLQVAGTFKVTTASTGYPEVFTFANSSSASGTWKYQIPGTATGARNGSLELLDVVGQPRYSLSVAGVHSWMNTAGAQLFSISNAGTAQVYSEIVTTGVTQLIVRAGAGQSTTNLQTWQNAAGSAQVYVASDFGIKSAGTYFAVLNAAGSLNEGVYGIGVQIASGRTLAWSSTTDAAATKDLTLSRAGINIGQFGDGGSNSNGLIYLKGVRPVGSTVANLPTAAGNTGMMATATDATVTTIGTTVAGGGANTVLVWSNGTNWRIYAN
jgi:hypothetical protein